MKTTIYDITEECRGRIIAVSDIHGHGHYLKELLGKISFTKEDVLVIVGDLIEKGGDSLATVRYCMELQRQNFHIYMSAGNVDITRIGTFLDRSEGHGKRFLDELRWAKEVWKCGFFLEILAELGVELSQINEGNVKQLKERIAISYAKEIAFLCDRPTIITCGNYIFVHAGVPTDHLEVLAEEDGFSFLKMDAFLEQKHCFEHIVVVGHWPVYLYQRDMDCMNPLFDYKQHAIAIDGGCALKIGGQLNALIIPNPYAPMSEIDTAAYDDYPVMYAKTAQKAVPATVCIKYFNAEVELLQKKQLLPQEQLSPQGSKLQEKLPEPQNLEEMRGAYLGVSDIVTLRHKSSGIIFDAPEKFLYRREDKLLCNGFINAALNIEAGCALKQIVKTGAGSIVKKDGRMGWYFGELSNTY